MNERTLVIIVGTVSITATLTSSEKKGKEVLFSLKEDLKIEKEMNVSKVLSLTLKSIDNVLNELFNKRILLPTRVHFVLSPLWFISEFRNVSIKRDKPFLFTAKLADQLLRKEADLFQEEKREIYGDLREGDLEVLELKTMRTLLNGYETNTLFGKKIKELEMSIFISLTERSFIDKLKNTLTKYFQGTSIKFHSSAMISFITARELILEEDFLLITTGGEITEVSLIKKGELKSVSSYPYGITTMVREIANEEKIDIDEAHSLFFLFKEKRMNEATLNKIEKILEKVKSRWIQSLEKSIKNVTEDILIPSTVLLSTHQEFSEFFTSAILKEEMNQYDWTKEKFNVTFIPKERLLSLYFNSFI